MSDLRLPPEKPLLDQFVIYNISLEMLIESLEIACKAAVVLEGKVEKEALERYVRNAKINLLNSLSRVHNDRNKAVEALYSISHILAKHEVFE